MHLKNEQHKLQKLIARNQFEAAFQQLSLLLPVNSAEVSHLVILENLYWTNLREEKLGLVAPETTSRTRNQLAKGLLELIQSLSEEQLQASQPVDFRTAIAEVRALLVKQERIPHAFARLEQLIQSHFEHLMALLSPLRVDYSTNHTDHVIAGTLEREKYLTRLRQIVRGTEELIAQLNAEYEKLNGHNFTMGSDLAVVSCNRRKIIRRFWQRFEQKAASEHPVMFYLLGEQKYGQAESLVRRLITLLKEDKHSVKYSGFSQIGIPLIDFMPDDDEEDCRFSLRKGFNRGLRQEVNNLQAFMGRIDTHYPGFSRYRYIPWVLKFNMPETLWKRNGKQMLKWFIQQFCRVEGRYKQCLVFFLIIDLKPKKKVKAGRSGGWLKLLGNRTSETNQPAIDLQQDLRALADQSSDITTALPPLALVVEDDLLDWYRILEPNERARERKVAEIISKLPPGDAWYMADVEECLREVMEEHQNALHGI